jgi:hypothetical protein
MDMILKNFNLKPLFITKKQTETTIRTTIKKDEKATFGDGKLVYLSFIQKQSLKYLKGKREGKIG